MELKKMTNLELLDSLKENVEIEKSYTHLVLKHLEEVERRKAFAELGHSSLFKYCVRVLKYSERETWTRISAMRLMKKDKEIEKKIEKDELNLTNASQIEGFSRQENLGPKETLALVQESEGKSTRDLKDLMEEKKDPETSSKPEDKEKTVRLSVSSARKLEKVKKVLGDYRDEEILEMLLDEKLRKPRRKSKAQSRFGRYISKELKDFVFKRAGHTCEYDGCSEKRFLEVDHVIPRARGGENAAYNLRVLCSAHNQLERVKCFGPR